MAQSWALPRARPGSRSVGRWDAESMTAGVPMESDIKTQGLWASQEGGGTFQGLLSKRQPSVGNDGLQQREACWESPPPRRVSLQMTMTVTTNLPTPSFFPVLSTNPVKGKSIYLAQLQAHGAHQVSGGQINASLLEFPVTLLWGRLVGKHFRAFLGRPASWSLRDRPVKSLPSMFADPPMLLKRSTSLLLLPPRGPRSLDGPTQRTPSAPCIQHLQDGPKFYFL